MPSGNRSTVVALGIALLLSAIFGTALTLEAGRLERTYEESARHKAENYRNSARIRAQARCATVPRAEIRACVYEEYAAAAQGEHDEYDLQAQLVTSVWTRTMGIAAVIGMAVGMFGIGLIYKTFEETRRAAQAAHDANKIARDQADHMRPWLSFANLEVRTMKISNLDESWIVEIVFRVDVVNNGSAPAKDVRAMSHGIEDPVSLETAAQIEVQAQHQLETGRGFPIGILPPNGVSLYRHVTLCVVPAVNEQGETRAKVWPGLMLAVSYRAIGSDTKRQTVQIFHVSALRPDQDLDLGGILSERLFTFPLETKEYQGNTITITAGSRADRAT